MSFEPNRAGDDPALFLCAVMLSQNRACTLRLRMIQYFVENKKGGFPL